MSNLREINCASAPTALRAVLLHRPDAHPVWHTYQVSLVHLRPIEGGPPPELRSPDSSHEIVIQALDPESQPDPEVPTIALLTPPNLVHQLRGRTDEMALTVFGAFVQALAAGELNPDTDHRQGQIAWLNRWGKSS
jgi:hypothetical protein